MLTIGSPGGYQPAMRATFRSAPLLRQPAAGRDTVQFGQQNWQRPAQPVLNAHGLKNPFEATVQEIRPLTSNPDNEIYHVVLDISGSQLNYLEGQSIGILTPGTDANGKNHKLRLYSVTSPAGGENGDGKTVSIAVKKVKYLENGQEKTGTASNYIAGFQVGDKVQVTGPAGRAFLMPPNPGDHLIMIGTGVGLAPFRSFLKTRLQQPAQGRGETWMIGGFPTRGDFLYGQELEAARGEAGYHLLTAFSREEQTADGQKMYVQHRILENADALWDLLQKPDSYLYICGMKALEKSVEDAFAEIARRKGESWPPLLAKLKQEKRWRVEVF